MGHQISFLSFILNKQNKIVIYIILGKKIIFRKSFEMKVNSWGHCILYPFINFVIQILKVLLGRLLFALFIVIFLFVTAAIHEIQITMMTQRSEYALHCIVNFYNYINNIYNDIIWTNFISVANHAWYFRCDISD